MCNLQHDTRFRWLFTWRIYRITKTNLDICWCSPTYQQHMRSQTYVLHLYVVQTQLKEIRYPRISFQILRIALHPHSWDTWILSCNLLVCLAHWPDATRDLGINLSAMLSCMKQNCLASIQKFNVSSALTDLTSLLKRGNVVRGCMYVLYLLTNVDTVHTLQCFGRLNNWSFDSFAM